MKVGPAYRDDMTPSCLDTGSREMGGGDFGLGGRPRFTGFPLIIRVNGADRSVTEAEAGGTY